MAGCCRSWLACSGSLDGKGQDRIDVLRPRREHQRAVEAERDPAAIGEAGLERREQALIESGLGKAEPAALFAVALEAAALLARGGELMKSVGELDPVAVELEALRRARVVRIELGERGLTRGIAVHEGQPVSTEPRPDDSPHQ